MARYIDAEMLTEEINTINERVVSQVRVGWSSWSILETIKNMPTADVRPERYGEWVYGEFDIPHCSECGKEVMPCDISKYCPNCGAKMDGKDGELNG